MCRATRTAYHPTAASGSWGSRPTDRSRLWTGADARLATLPAFGYWGPTANFTPDNRHLALLRGRRLDLFDVATQQSTPVADLGADALMEPLSPDGRWVFCFWDEGKDDTTDPAVRRGPARPEGVPLPRLFPSISWTRGGALSVVLLTGVPRSNRRRARRPTRPPDVKVIDMQNIRVVCSLRPPTTDVYDDMDVWSCPGVPYCVFPSDSTRQGQWLWIADVDAHHVRRLRFERRAVLGMARDGSMILWDGDRTFIRWNPQTNEERPLVRL